MLNMLVDFRDVQMQVVSVMKQEADKRESHTLEPVAQESVVEELRREFGIDEPTALASIASAIALNKIEKKENGIALPKNQAEFFFG